MQRSATDRAGASWAGRGRGCSSLGILFHLQLSTTKRRRFSMTLIAHCGTKKISRDELRNLPVPEATKTHKPISHHELVGSLVETLAFRHIHVVRDEYAVSADGMKRSEEHTSELQSLAYLVC